MNNLTFEEFYKSCYHTQYNVVIPLVNRMRISKSQFIIKGKYNVDILKSKLMEIYDKNFNK